MYLRRKCELLDTSGYTVLIEPYPISSISHLYSLSIVNLHNMETKTVDSSPWGLEYTGSEVEMITNVDEYL